MNSRDKILKNIKKNISKIDKAEVIKPIMIEGSIYSNKKDIFIKNFIKAGGELTNKIKGVVLKANFAVAENGACYFDDIDDRKNFTFYKEITILLDKNNIVDNMHQAYKKIKLNSFGIFIAGPSKTADIEQSLVIGAHGAKKCYLLLFSSLSKKEEYKKTQIPK